ncbi:MAG: tetratricopeptide repeat protein [Candidatus Hydrogenedentes bacterium]|nr:tetratricopeptide repeat protein [Candidatus Hydrogenedentota bacterium]
MMRYALCFGLATALLGANAAAASKQVEALLYDTHQKVTNLSRSLDGTVKRLDETTTSLMERVNESENQTRQLRSMVEENQMKLDALQQQLGELTATVYRQFNLTTSGSGYSPAAPAASGQSVVIQPPAPAAETFDEDMSAESVSAAPPVAGGSSAAAHAAYQEAQKAWLGQDYDGALRQFSDFLARYPGSDLAGNAQYWQGRCFLRLERYEEAIASLDKVRANHPENDSKVSQAMQSQAVALSRLGRNDEAVRLLQEVIDKYPNTVVAQQAQSDLAKLRGN